MLSADNYTRFLLLRRTTQPDETMPQTPESTFYRAASPSALSHLVRHPSIHLIAVHTRAYPQDQTNGNAIQLEKTRIHDAVEAYTQKYNKRYLVEVVGEVGDDVPGLTRL